MSKTQTKKKRHRLRRLFLLGSVVGIAAAVKKAIDDKGSSYEAPVVPASKPAATPAPVATEPDIDVADRPVRDEPVADEPAPFPAPPATRVQTAEEVLESQPATTPAHPLDSAETPTETTKKIDPFGAQ